MNTRAKVVIMKDRLQKLENSSKNIKSSGVVKKLKRQIRNLDK